MFDEQKRQAELDKREAQIQKAKAEAQNEAFLQLEKQLNQLITSRDAAMAELEKLREANESTWTSFLQKTDSMFQSAAEKFHAYVSTHH